MSLQRSLSIFSGWCIIFVMLVGFWAAIPAEAQTTRPGISPDHTTVDGGQYVYYGSGIGGSIPEVEEFKRGVEEGKGLRGVGSAVSGAGQAATGTSSSEGANPNLANQNLNVWNNTLSYTALSIFDPGSVLDSPSLVSALGSSIAFFYGSPPATTERYVADLIRSTREGIVPPAYAQGIGFSSLDPILETWKIFRNLAYLFFILIIVVIGFLIMFRQKVGGQAAITAQQAIPRIVTSLIFVTFSYAIAGLAIDFMYLLMWIMTGVFETESFLTGVASLAGVNEAKDFTTGSIFRIGAVFFTEGVNSVYDVMRDFVDNVISNSDGFDIGDLLAVVGGLPFMVIVGVALAIKLFQLFFELIKTYVSILISITLAPVILMIGAIPGKNAFGPWLKSLIGNLMAWPTVLFILLLFGSLKGNLVADTSGGFMPPYLLGGVTSLGSMMSAIIGIGMILILPDLVKQTKKAFGATGGPFEQLTGAVGDSVKAGWKGGELLPGVAATNTSRLPFFGSGRDAFSKAAIGASLPVGAIEGTRRHVAKSRELAGSPGAKTGRAGIRSTVGSTIGNTAKWVGGVVGDKHITNKKDKK